MIRTYVPSLRGSYHVEYHQTDSFDNLSLKLIRQVYGVCFFNDQVILGFTNRNSWILPGGTREEGESTEQTLKREVQEETNTLVKYFHPIGYQKVWSDTDPETLQLRFYCQVKPIGSFEKDGDEKGSILANKLVAPEEAITMLDWGQVGQAIFDRAIQLHQEHSATRG